ncbi:MAG: hypothetical protein J1F38_07025 [Muribaculaceae bacterium]|nr:hypothetical protein [Muribaculaceae bacterium]
MQELTNEEITGFLIIGGGSILLSYILLKLKDILWIPLILWGLGTTTWFIYNKANVDALWFMNLDQTGVFLGSLGCLLFGLYIAIQTFMMFELTAKVADDKRSMLIIPLMAVIAGVVLCLIKAEYIDISIWWIWGPALALVISIAFVFFNGGIDADQLGSIFGIILLLGCTCMYVYTFTDVMANSGATICGIIFFYFLFRKSGTKELMMGYSYDSRNYKPITSSLSTASSVSSVTMPTESTKEAVRPSRVPMMLITFKGKYYLNGMKVINKTIRCTQAEARQYTTYMYDADSGEAWIKANYPGADITKGWSLNVNIKKEQ